jgi:hypothetical protein
MSFAQTSLRANVTQPWVIEYKPRISVQKKTYDLVMMIIILKGGGAGGANPKYNHDILGEPLRLNLNPKERS